MINNGTIFLSDLEFISDWFHRGLMPAEDVPVLELAVLPGVGQTNELIYWWNVTNQDRSGTLFLQIYFDQPGLVSTGDMPDIVQVKFNDPLLFLGTNGRIIDTETRVVKKTLSRQIEPGFGEKFQNVMDAVSIGSRAAVAGTIAMNIVIVGALN